MKRITKFNRTAARRLTGSQEQPMQEPWQMLHEQQQQNGPGVLEPAEFQKKVLDGVDAQGKQLKTLGDKLSEVSQNLDKASGDTKKAFEDLAKVQQEQKTFGEQLNAVRRAQLAVHHEVRTNWADPVRRFSQNTEIREFINAFVRAQCKIDISPRQKDLLKEAGVTLGEKTIIQPEQRDLSEGSSPGSTYLRDELARMIYDALPEFGIWNTLSVEPMGTKNMIMPVDTADPIALVFAEGASIDDDTNITGTSVTAVAKKIAALLKVSRELLQDAEYDVTGRVMKKFLRACAKRMDYLAFRADGTNDATNGAFTGVFNFGTAVTAASGNTTVETLDFEDVTAVPLGAAEAVIDRAARWWMHPFILIRFLSIKDANGRPIFLNALEAPTPGGIGSILGFPVTLGHVLPVANTAGSKVAAFGDPDAYAVGLRQDVEFDFSDHALWTSDQRAFRMIARAAFKGRLATALTLLKTAAS